MKRRPLLRFVALATAVTLAGCGGNSGGGGANDNGSGGDTARLGADRQIFEDFELHGGGIFGFAWAALRRGHTGFRGQLCVFDVHWRIAAVARDRPAD